MLSVKGSDNLLSDYLALTGMLFELAQSVKHSVLVHGDQDFSVGCQSHLPHPSLKIPCLLYKQVNIYLFNIIVQAKHRQ